MNNPDAAAPGQRSGADLLCDTLLAEGVDMCFANPGTSEMHFVAALDRQPNRKYAILHGELKHVGAAAAGENARRMLDLDNPALDWVALAKGMEVEGTRVDTAEAFNSALAAALKASGPFLIEAVI